MFSIASSVFIFLILPDILRRVSVVFHQHIEQCESVFSSNIGEETETGDHHFNESKIEIFSEENYVTPKYNYRFLPGRAPLTRMGVLYGVGLMKSEFSIPTLNEVHTFIRDLFVKAQLSAECSIGNSIRISNILLIEIYVHQNFLFFFVKFV